MIMIIPKGRKGNLEAKEQHVIATFFYSLHVFPEKQSIYGSSLAKVPKTIEKAFNSTAKNLLKQVCWKSLENMG